MWKKSKMKLKWTAQKKKTYKNNNNNNNILYVRAYERPCFYCKWYKNEFDTVVSVEMSLLLAVVTVVLLLLPMMLLLQPIPLLAVVAVLPWAVVSFEAFIKLIVGRLAKTAGGGGNAVGNCAGWDIVTPVALFVMYIAEFVAYIAFGRAKSIYSRDFTMRRTHVQ